MNQLGIKEGFGVAPNIVYQGLDKVLRFATTRTDKYPVTGVNVAEELLLGGKLFRPDCFQSLQVFQTLCVHNYRLFAAEVVETQIIWTTLLESLILNLIS